MPSPGTWTSRSRQVRQQSPEETAFRKDGGIEILTPLRIAGHLFLSLSLYRFIFGPAASSLVPPGFLLVRSRLHTPEASLAGEHRLRVSPASPVSAFWLNSCSLLAIERGLSKCGTRA